MEICLKNLLAIYRPTSRSATFYVSSRDGFGNDSITLFRDLFSASFDRSAVARTCTGRPHLLWELCVRYIVFARGLTEVEDDPEEHSN